MTILTDWNLQIDVDQILRAQGADPALVRGRSPRLVRLAEQALHEVADAIEPKVLFSRLAVEKVVHDRILLAGGNELRGALIRQHLVTANEVIFMLCTIGHALDERIAQALDTDIVYGLALDGLGSAAVETLANTACHQFDMKARENGLETSIPLSPGMSGWPVGEGQPQIFRALDAEQIGIRVTSSWVMQPRKSLSIVVGVGPQMLCGSPCDVCSMRDSCRYQDHYARIERFRTL
jgi:hypothetical protein